jgi:hypothetical protein
MDFLAIYGVEIVLSGLGVEITPLIRYLATESTMINFSFFLYQSGEKKRMMTIDSTNGKIIRSRGFTTFASPDDLNEKVRIVAEFNGRKAIYEFFYKRGEICPAF